MVIHWYFSNPLINCDAYSKFKRYILQALSTHFIIIYAVEDSVYPAGKVNACQPICRLGFSGSLWHSQADEARQTGHAEANSPDDRHADQTI